MVYHLVTDNRTHATMVLGRSGARYTPREVDRALRRAARGDARAAATVDDLDWSGAMDHEWEASGIDAPALPTDDRGWAAAMGSTGSLT